MKAAHTVLVVCFLSALAGCGPTNVKTTTMPAVDTGLVSLIEGLMSGNDPASIGYVTLDHKPICVVWSDGRSGSNGAGSSSSGPITPHGKLIFSGSDTKPNREIEYSGKIHGSEKGELTINGTTYDLAKGGLFLVSGMDGNVRVKQLKSDMSELKFERNDLVVFCKANPDITDFFSKPAKPKLSPLPK